MLGLKWRASQAGLVGWGLALAIAMIHFGTGLEVVIYAQLKGLLLTLDVLYIIWSALLLFHVADQAGAIQVIADRLPRLTSERLVQGLLLGWVFSSFLQGVGGFGVPIAVVAPLLVGLGFEPVTAVVMASLGHAWAVTFGSLASSFQALMGGSGLPGPLLAPPAALMLGVAGLGSGMAVAHAQAGKQGIRQGLLLVVLLSAVMGTIQYGLAVNRLWTLGATGAGLAGLVVGVGLARLWNRQLPDTQILGGARGSNGPGGRSLALSLVAYVFLIVLAFALNLVPPLADIFNRVQLTLIFPELVTNEGWVVPAGPGRSISLFGHGGAILLYTSLLAYTVYRRARYYELGAAGRIVRGVVKSALPSSLGILAMVGMAVTMSHAGMTYVLAQGLSVGVGGGAYPLVAPWIGALGAFMTGSNTNSNVVFTALQQQTATLLGLPVPLILAAQTAGGALGSVLAPTKIIVGCSTVNLSGQEGRVLRASLPYGLALIASMSLLAWLLVALA
jgi:lactate permease